MIHLSSDYSSIDRELDRVANQPNFKTTAALKAVLQTGFAQTQAEVHVQTGSLKSSGRTSSDTDHSKWTGELEYGGPSAGVNNPVDYAIYEKNRDGEHDFFESLPALHPLWVGAMKTGLAP